MCHMQKDKMSMLFCFLCCKDVRSRTHVHTVARYDKGQGNEVDSVRAHCVLRVHEGYDPSTDGYCEELLSSVRATAHGIVSKRLRYRLLYTQIITHMGRWPVAYLRACTCCLYRSVLAKCEKIAHTNGRCAIGAITAVLVVAACRYRNRYRVCRVYGEILWQSSRGISINLGSKPCEQKSGACLG